MAVVSLAFSAAAARASFADSAPAQLAAARELFTSAEVDEDALRWQEALEKLQKVAEVKLTSGVRYHTALCEEHLGHLLAALRDYTAAANQARLENAADVLRLVDKRIEESKARIPQVTVVVAPSTPGAVIQLDGKPIALGVPVSVDPGAHNLDASAAGRKPSTRIITLEEGVSRSFQVRLDPWSTEPASGASEPGPEAIRGAAGDGPPARSATRVRWTVIAAAGAAMLAGAGVAAYWAAGQEHTQSVRGCATVVSTDPNACASQKNVVRALDWTAIGAWAGAAAAGTFAVLALTKPHYEAPPAPSARLVIFPGSASLEGSF